MKILTFSTLYPNAARPIHGIFVETRLRQLLASGQIASKVSRPCRGFRRAIRGSVITPFTLAHRAKSGATASRCFIPATSWFRKLA